MSQLSRGTYHFGEFQLNLDLRVLVREGQRVPLGPKAYDVLTCLVIHAGHTVSKTDLLKQVWPESFVEEGTLAQHVFSLRKALGDKADCIVTVPGFGYRFAGTVRHESADAAQTWPPQSGAGVLHEMRERTHMVVEEPVLPSPATRKFWLARLLKTPWFLYTAGAALVLLVVAGVIVWRMNRPIPGNYHEVVLSAFQNNTGDPEFDGTLDTALAIDLKQSPYVVVAPSGKVAETMKEMERPAGEVVTPTLAREVCQRLNDQAVLSSAIARFGQKYLITLTAVDCSTGNELVEMKAVAKDGDNVLDAVGTLAADMRRKLGESLKSVRRFDKPLLVKRTRSLDALKAYTQAREVAGQGKWQDALPLLQRAVELDPQFAAAYADMGSVLNNLGEHQRMLDAMTKAYQLRDQADDRDRFYITAVYHATVTGDLNETIRNYEAWTEVYSDASAAWFNMADAQIQIGRQDLAVQSASKGFALDPENPVGYILLSRAQLATGQIEQAKQTCSLAMQRHLDGMEIHGVLLGVAMMQDDQAAIDQQVAWAKGTKAEPFILMNEALVLYAQGRPKAARDVFDQMYAYYKAAGLNGRADAVRTAQPLLELTVGEPEAARARMAAFKDIPTSNDMAVALAELGDTPRAEAMLNAQLQQHPQDTLWQFYRAPFIRGAIAMNKHRPQDAIEALKPALPYDLRGLETIYLRGNAYLEAGQPQLAAAEFQKELDHVGVEPRLPSTWLAQLGLARALAASGDPTKSREAYRKFFEKWKSAEPDEPILLKARAEFAALP